MSPRRRAVEPIVEEQGEESSELGLLLAPEDYPFDVPESHPSTAEPGFVRIAFDHYTNAVGLPGDRIARVIEGVAYVAESDAEALVALGGRVLE